MSDVEVAGRARNVLAAMDTENRVGQFRVAGFTRALSNAKVVALDLDIVWIAAGCERE